MADYNTIKAALVDIFLKRGDQTSFRISLFDPDDSDNPVDLSGYDSLYMQVKVDALRSDNLIELSTGSGLTITGAGNNQIDGVINHDIKAGVYPYDIEGRTAGVSPKTVVEGEFYYDQDVTRA